jgi:membrane-associated protease RseP (regulator of RpoE activity)
MHHRIIHNRRHRIAAVAFVAATVLASSLPGSAQETKVVVKDGEHVFRWASLGRGYIGVEVLPLTPELREHFGVPSDAGVLVSRVEEGGPSEAAGIAVGDILTGVDGEMVADTGRLARAIREKDAGDSVSIELWRDGSVMTMPVTVAERERPVFDVSRFRFLPGGPGVHSDSHDFTYFGPGVELELDAETMGAVERAMKELEERIDTGEWRESLERLDSLDFNAIQDRMREVEKRLQELEEELGKEKERDVER